MTDSRLDNIKSIKHGKATYQNLDETGMNESKEKTLKFFDKYINAGQNIATSIVILENLLFKNNLKLFNKYSPAFTSVMIDSLVGTCVIQLTAFFRNSDKLSLHKLFNYIRSNYNKIFTGKFQRVINYNDGTTEESIREYDKDNIFKTVEDCENLIQANETLIEKFKIFRDEIYGHFSDGKQLENIENSLLLEEMKTLLNLAERIVNKIKTMYDGGYECFEPINAKDVNSIIHIIKTYDRNRNDIDEIIIEKDMRKIFGEKNDKNEG